MLRPTVLLLSALAATTACASLSAQPLVDVDIVDRDTGHPRQFGSSEQLPAEARPHQPRQSPDGLLV